MGAGEICINSIDNDGTVSGYDIQLMKLAEEAVSVPLIASGGGESLARQELFTETASQVAIISSMLYSPRLKRNYRVAERRNICLVKI